LDQEIASLSIKQNFIRQAGELTGS